MEWTNKKMLELIHFYESEPVLWDPQNPNHKKKHITYYAWERIKTNLSSEVTVQEIKVKIKYLTAYYKRQLKKYLKPGTSTDKDYQTNWFAFSKMNSFLSPIYKCQSTISVPQQLSSMENCQENLLPSSTTVAHQPACNLNFRASDKKKTQNSINTEETLIKKSPEPSVEIQVQDKKRNNEPPEHIEARQQTQEAVNDIKTIKLDLLEFYTKFLETNIRSISDPNTQRIFMNELSTLCFRAEMANKAANS